MEWFTSAPPTANLMGNRFIPCVFSLTYRRPLTRYTAGRIARTRDARGLLRTLPWLPRVLSVIDISTVIFADDVRVVHPIRINTQSTPNLEARRIVKMATDEAEHMTREIAKEGYAQNVGKAELLPRLHGAGSHLVPHGS